DIAVFRLIFRGVRSPRGTSDGSFGEGIEEKKDLEAALIEAERLGLPRPWLIGWSFGTEVILKHAREHTDRIAGVILLSPPLHRTTQEELVRWQDSPVPVVALIPEFDDFLPPQQATEGFAVAPSVELVMAEGAKHLWVGEKQTRFVLNEITKRLNPAAAPLPEAWSV
ncbi:MAG: alpha/beta fold hydrolase, partial [Pontimonas sp.]